MSGGGVLRGAHGGARASHNRADAAVGGDGGKTRAASSMRSDTPGVSSLFACLVMSIVFLPVRSRSKVVGLPLSALLS